MVLGVMMDKTEMSIGFQSANGDSNEGEGKKREIRVKD